MNKRELNDLMDKIQNGNEEAFLTLYNETCKGVFSFAYSIVRNSHDAEDIMQDTYIKIRRFAQSYSTQGNVSAWILQITKNLAYDFLKKDNKTFAVQLNSDMRKKV